MSFNSTNCALEVLRVSAALRVHRDIGRHHPRVGKTLGFVVVGFLVVVSCCECCRDASRGVFFVLQTPNGLLLTPSPLLSSIHFWSSLSPVAPLSPARLQGPNTLFQVGLPNARGSCVKMHVEETSGEHLTSHIGLELFKWFEKMQELVGIFKRGLFAYTRLAAQPDPPGQCW